MGIIQPVAGSDFFDLIGENAMADAIPRIKVIELQCVLLCCRKLFAGIFTNIIADMDMKYFISEFHIFHCTDFPNSPSGKRTFYIYRLFPILLVLNVVVNGGSTDCK